MFNLSDFFGYVKNTVLSVRPIDIIDIIIVSVLIYYAVKFFRDRRAAKLLIGIVFLIIIYFISDVLKMYVLNFMLARIFEVGLIALIVVFQPELRSLLEKVGGTSISSINRIVDHKNNEKSKDAVSIISAAAAKFSEAKQGALIVMERTTKLGDTVKSGVKLNSDLSVELLDNIFYNKAPLHDGAVIINNNNQIEAAKCVLPLSSSPEVPANVGTRHRAGIGISENSDAVVVIVSEETGKISVAVDGKLERNFNKASLEKKLRALMSEHSSIKNNKNLKNPKNIKIKKSSKKGE